MNLVSVILAITCVQLSQFVQASDEVKMADMIRAPSISKLKLTIKETHRLENIRAQCEIQLKYGMLPTQCFEVIRIEKRDRLLTDEKFQRTWMWLSDNCNERAVQTGDIETSDSQLKLLPKPCRDLALRKMGDQQYRDVTMNPSLLFKRRL